MTGEELYWLYQKAHSDLNNYGTDEWAELPQTERNVWERLAEKVSQKY